MQRISPAIVTLLLVTAGAIVAQAQTVTQKGFVEAQGIAYPQTTAKDDTQLMGEALLRYEASQFRLGPNRTGPLGILQPVADGIKLFF